MNKGKSSPSTAGVTLVELMVTVVILSVAGLGIAGSYTYIARANQVHRTTTLGSNLSQEQMEVLKNKNYFEVIPTTTPSYNANFNPPIPYDNALYPPSTVNIGNMAFTRLTYVERVSANGNTLIFVSPDSLDTGLKRITITTVWQIGGNWYQKSLSNLMASSQYSSASGFTGTVIDAATLLPIQGADVFATGDSLFHDFTDNNGKYTMAATPGHFSVQAQSAGYFPQTFGPYSIANGSITSVNFSLSARANGSVSGSAWVNNHILISQVVTATNTNVAGGGAVPQLVEYIELFNPTTYQINVTPAPPLNTYLHDYIRINALLGGAVNGDIMSPTPPGGIAGVYVSTYIAAGGYYLVANYSAFLANGKWITADAYFQNMAAPPHYLSRNSYGAVQVTDSLGNTLDQVCWQGTGGVPAGSGYLGTTYPLPGQYCNGTPVPLDSNCGMNAGAGAGCAAAPYLGNQLVRFSSITVLNRTMYAGTYGSAYNSQINAVDFKYPVAASPATLGLNYNPFVSTSPVLPVISGTPAYGAVVTCNDGLSASTQAWQTSVAGFNYATYTLVGIATGTWTVDISSGFDYLSISSVAVLTPSLSTTIPNNVTFPPWALTGLTNALLTGTTTNGLITGQVVDPNGNPLSGIQVAAHGTSPSLTAANGRYVISAPAGTYSVVANPNNVNGSFSSQQSDSIVVSAGQIANGNDFTLSGAGRVNGYVCDFSAANVYPGVTVNALDGNGNSVAQVVTNSNGNFSVKNLSTGTYTFEPVLDPDQTAGSTSVGSCSAAGTSISCQVVAGTNISIGTFTITGAYGTIVGSATCCGAGGGPITTGALILATTGSIVGALPPDISSAVVLSAPYYMASSLSDGSFSLSVRASTAADHFNLYGWYTTYNGSTPVITKKSVNVNVTGGQVTNAGLQW
ncbi:MAG: carboxypeptidase regulatory-like domain-containing protein [Elusimicrobiota bacterium]